MWDDHRKEFRFTLYEPDRAKTWSSSEIDLTAGSVLGYNDLTLDSSKIRNVVDVEYSAAITDGTAAAIFDNSVEAVRSKRTVSDATSITKYGRRYCKVGLASTSQIDTAAEAERLANGILADLKDPKANGAAEVLHRFEVDIEDMVRVRVDGQRFSLDQDFAVVGVRHRIDAGSRRTAITIRDGKPVGGVRRWHERWLVSKGHRPGKGKSPPPQPTGLALTPIPTGLQVTWDQPVGRGAWRYRDTEIHVGPPGFTPDASSLRARTFGKLSIIQDLIASSGPYGVKVIHRDDMRNISATSAQETETPRWMPKTPGMKAGLSSNITSGLLSGKNADFFVGAAALPVTTADHTSAYGGGIFTAPVDGFAMVAAGIVGKFAGSQTIRPVARHYRGATLIQEIEGKTGAAGTTTSGWLPGSGVAAAAPSAQIYCIAGDTVTLGYEASAVPTDIVADPATYFVVRMYDGPG
jgi:hypothetical protein